MYRIFYCYDQYFYSGMILCSNEEIFDDVFNTPFFKCFWERYLFPTSWSFYNWKSEKLITFVSTTKFPEKKIDTFSCLDEKIIYCFVNKLNTLTVTRKYQRGNLTLARLNILKSFPHATHFLSNKSLSPLINKYNFTVTIPSLSTSLCCDAKVYSIK